MNQFELTNIAKNDSYQLSVNKSKNCIIISFLGIWDKTSKLDNYLEDIKKAIGNLSSGFNIFIDLTHYRGSTSEYLDLHIEALKTASCAGLNKTAVFLYNNPMLKITVDHIFNQSGIKAAYFDSRMKAEYWLSL
jgi:hypothetical protein